MRLRGVADLWVPHVIGKWKRQVYGCRNVLAVNAVIARAVSGSGMVMALSKHKTTISFSFERREGNALPAPLWIHVEDAVREAVEGTIFELVHTEAVGFERGKGITQWP